MDVLFLLYQFPCLVSYDQSWKGQGKRNQKIYWINGKKGIKDFINIKHVDSVDKEKNSKNREEFFQTGKYSMGYHVTSAGFNFHTYQIFFLSLRMAFNSEVDNGEALDG